MRREIRRIFAMLLLLAGLCAHTAFAEYSGGQAGAGVHSLHRRCLGG